MHRQSSSRCIGMPKSVAGTGFPGQRAPSLAHETILSLQRLLEWVKPSRMNPQACPTLWTRITWEFPKLGVPYYKDPTI